MEKNIKIFFDTNTWSDVADLPVEQRQLLMEGVKKAQESDGLIIHFSPVNVFEFLKGVKEDDSLGLCQAKLKRAAHLTKEHLLESPWDHVRRGSVKLAELDPPGFDRSFLQLIRIVVIANKYSEVKPLVTELRTRIINFQESWLALTRETKQKIQKGENLDELNDRPGRIKELWRSFRQHFRLLEPEFAKLDWSVAYSELPLFRFWSQIQIRYMDRLLLSDFEPTESDYFDIEQTIYFDIMDYLITNDKKLRSLVEESKEPELQGRILRVEEFIQNISTLTKRAVCNSSSKWIELSENL